jgi:alkaline phosphatase
MHLFRRVPSMIVGLASFVGGGVRAADPPAAVPVPAVATRPADRLAKLQWEATHSGTAAWGHWGDQPGQYISWSNHSNRLVPVYTFGLSLDGVAGERSPYRSEERLRAIYGRLPDHSLNPAADYFDQTDVHSLQTTAAATGKRRIILMVFDGLDWTTTRTAAIALSGKVAYDSGRGTGLSFQDYSGVQTAFGFCCTSPANDGTKIDVDAQALKNPGGDKNGGYDASMGGATPWDPAAQPTYLIGRDRYRPHAVCDSAASATAFCSGHKTYNDAINVDPAGAHLEPIARTLQKQGWAVGAVTSVPIPHATPACAYANNVSRDDYQDILRDMVGVRSVSHRGEPLPGLDVVLGCGMGVADPDDRDDQGTNYEPPLKYAAVSTLREIDAASGGRYKLAVRTAGRKGGEVLAEGARAAIADGRRLFGWFGTREGNLPFATADGGYDPVIVSDEARKKLFTLGEQSGLGLKYSQPIHYTQADFDENPTLAEMAVAALDVLAAKEKPFWLMVEAGDVDWASHGNDIDAAIGAVKSGDDAFRAITGWIEAHGGWDDTAVIVTSDHGHMFVLEKPEAFAR